MASNSFDLTMTAGLPYRRRVRVVGAAKIWSATEDFEVRSQVRVAPSTRSTLKSTLTPFITSSIEGEDIVLDLSLTGSESKTVSGGYYDVILSDKGSSDERALRVLHGRLHINPLVTAGSDG